MFEPIVLPPLDTSFAEWLATQPLMECNMREDLQIIRQCLRGRSPTEFVDGRDAAQRVRSVEGSIGRHMRGELVRGNDGALVERAVIRCAEEVSQPMLKSAKVYSSSIFS